MSLLLSIVVAGAERSMDVDALAETRASFAAQGAGPWELVAAGTESTLAARLGAGVARTTGRFVAVLEAGDRLEPGALAAVAGYLEGTPEPGVVYTDEQWPAPAGQGIFTKPRWIPRYLEAYPYLGRLCFIRRDVHERAGGFREDFAPAREWDLALRVTELATEVRHIPVLGISRANPPAVDGLALEAGRAAVAARYDRLGVRATTEITGRRDGDAPGFLRVWREVGSAPLVSIVVPTAGTRRDVDGVPTLLVANALRSVVDRTSYRHWEVILVTSERTPAEVVEECTAILGDRLRTVPVAGDFNFSRSINTGVGAARGDLVLLLNDDTEVVERRWLERMVAVASEEGVGAVGAKLLFGDGRVQHTGVVFDLAGEATHVHIFEADDAGHFGSKVVDLDYLAVTGACLLVTRSVFEEVGGFNEALPLNYNDVDFCLKVGATGRAVVCTPFARLRHFESSSRAARLEDEERAALAWWGPRKSLDPYVNVRGVG